MQKPSERERRLHHNPQTEEDILVVTTPCPTWPPFNCTKTFSVMLKPEPAMSTAVMLPDTPVAVLVR